MDMDRPPNSGVVTDEDLDEFLAVGSQALRGARLIRDCGEDPDAAPPEFIRGNVLPTDSCGVAETDDTESWRALVRHFWRK